jgi:hypothetical protein
MRIAASMVGFALLVPAPGHAALIASCSGRAPTISGMPLPQSIVLGATCNQFFKLSGRTTVTITLQPSLQFTGTLTGTVRGQDSKNVKGIFAGGQAQIGLASATYSIPAGDWEFEVRAGAPPPPEVPGPPCLPPQVPPPLPDCPFPPGAAFDDFAGILTA